MPRSRPSDETSGATRATWAAGLWSLLTLAAAVLWWRDGTPVAVPDASAGPLPCVPYAHRSTPRAGGNP